MQPPVTRDDLEARLAPLAGADPVAAALRRLGLRLMERPRAA